MAEKKPPETTPEFSALIAGREIVPVDLDSIALDPANARSHGPDSIRVIKDSLTLFGQTEPIGVQASTRKVIWGNGRVAAMREMGWKQCGAVILAVDNTTAAALSLASNRTAERSVWDFEALAANLKALEADAFDIGLLGWEAHELEPMLAADWSPPEIGELPSPESHDAKPHSLILSPDQWQVVEQAVRKLREAEGDDSITEGRAIELIAADYLAGS